MAAQGGGALIELEEEIEGEVIGTKNYRFCSIGEPVPILNSEFDPQCLPSQPLAVSERFRLLFVAHPHGFCVTRTKDVMRSAEEIKENGSGPSVGELSLVNVDIGKVSILALSVDDSSLAAILESNVHVFAVSALLHKEQRPSYSVSLDDSSCIKDMRWAKKDAKAYVILSENGKLYHGSGQGPPTCVMDNVDSVDWSVGGNSVAVAKRNTLSILSMQFKEKISFVLPFESVAGDSGVNKVIKVDSVRWVRPDCIAVGCFELNEDDDEENYIVQLVTSRGQRITDVDSKSILLSFNSVFIDYCSDAVPARNGPHMFLSYLARFEVAFIANRNLSRSVGLFSWSMNNGKNEAAVVEILDDAWSFHINEYQENDEENVLLGLCVDKVAQNEDIKFTLGDEEVEVSPCCVIICVTIDGKISVFHFVSAIGASSTSPEYAVSDEEDDATHISFGACEQSNEQTVSKSDSHTLTSSELGKSDAKATNMNQRPPFQIDLRSEEQAASKNTGQKPTENFRKLELNGHPENSLSISPIQDRNAEKQSISEVKSSPALFSAKEIGGLSSQSMGNSPLSGHRVEPLGKIRSSKDLPGAGFSTWSNDAMRSSAGRFLSPPPSHPVDSDKRALQSVGVPQKPTDLKDKINPSLASTSFGQTASAAVNRQSMPSYPAQVRLDDRIRSEKSPTGFPYSAQNAPKQFGNVEEMAKKLDTLLEGIQGKGGFVDQCITSQEKVVAGLEDSTQALNEICKTWRGLLDDQSMEVQLLLDKTVQALVRKEYMEGIFKQITDSRYWELWNRQKLSSELELKRRCILDLNQELTNQLIDLERHFNALELNKFGESGGTSRNRSVSRNWSGHSRQIQSLNTLHNTMIAQLAAAEHLSGCLSEQMSALSIDSSAKNDAKKQLFESIGLSYVGDSHKSAKDTAFNTPPNKEKSTPSYSVATKEQSRRNQVSNSKNYEADTARRRRDSLDRSWATYEPPKTTVSRMLLKDVEKGSASRSMVKMDRQYLTPQSQNKPEAAQAAIWSASGSSLNSNKSKGTAEATAKPSNESASTSLFQKRSGLLGNGTQGSSSLSFPALSPQSTFKSTTTRNNESEASTPQSIFKTAIFKNSESGASTPPSIFKTAVTQNSELGASRLTDEKSKDTIPFTLNSDSVASNKSKLFQQSTSGFNPVQSKSTWLPEQSLTSSSHSTESLSNSKLEFTKSSQEPNKPLDGAPASTTPLQSVFGSLTNSSNTLPSVSSFASKPSSQISFLVSSSSDASVSTKAGFTFPSTLSLSTPQSNLSTPSPSSTISRSESLTQVSDPPITMHGSKTEQNAQTLPSVANVPSTVEKDLKTQASTSQPVLAISKPDLNLGLSAPPTSTEALMGSKSGNQVDLGNSSMPTPIVRPDSKPEQPFATETPSPIAVSSDGNLGSVNNVISDESVEEEMEEEAPETNQTTEFSLGNLGGFGIGLTPNSTSSRQNPFGVSNPNLFGVSTPNPTTSPFQMPAPNGQLFRPASFDFQSPQTSQAQQQTNVNSFSGGFGTGNPGQVSGGSGFVQPAQMGAGAGQQALGSVLGTFGQSRQVGLGGGLPGSGGATPSGFGGGFAGVSGGGGFGGGFSSAATSGGFASLASAGGGGFAAAAAGAGGGFAAAAASGGGFAPAAGAGGGFASLSGAPVSGGGFGAFNQQGGGGGGGFSAFGGGGGSGGARPPLNSSRK